jgi:hypothetical protein
VIAMIGRPMQQGFFEAELDYRHEQLMREVGQCLVARRPFRVWAREAIPMPRHRRTSQRSATACTVG